jgi:hypothetical protein
MFGSVCERFVRLLPCVRKMWEASGHVPMRSRRRRSSSSEPPRPAVNLHRHMELEACPDRRCC